MSVVLVVDNVLKINTRLTLQILNVPCTQQFSTNHINSESLEIGLFR